MRRQHTPCVCTDRSQTDLCILRTTVDHKCRVSFLQQMALSWRCWNGSYIYKRQPLYHRISPISARRLADRAASARYERYRNEFAFPQNCLVLPAGCRRLKVASPLTRLGVEGNLPFDSQPRRQPDRLVPAQVALRWQYTKIHLAAFP